ncbi:MAG: DNA primase [Bacteroidales bacterium]|nr:DNA primase [Candidatus Cryptobacteroides aphodequi]
MIKQETVDLILDTVRIEDIVGDFVTLKRRGANMVACCPFHNERTPSFYVSPSKGIYKCFGCGKSGKAVTFLMEHEQMNYQDALRYIAAKYHIDVVEEEVSAEEIQQRAHRESLLLVSEFAHKFFVDQLSTPEGRGIAMTYYHSRGLEDETIRNFGLGWAPSGRTALVDAAVAAGHKVEYLIEAGLAVKREDGTIADRFRERVMFPIHSISGRVIAFSGRTLSADNPAKYVNSPETEIYTKSRELLGLFFAKGEISRLDKCYLVEGNVDVVTLRQLGILNVVASCGTSLTVEQIRRIKRFTPNLTIMYDGDSAGIHAAIRGTDMVLDEGMNVRIVLLPEGEDPDSFGRSHTLEEVRAYIAAHEVDFVSFKTDLLLADAGNDPYKRSALINDIADTIAHIPDPVQRTVYCETAARKFGVETSLIAQRVSRTRGAMREDRRKDAEREAARLERQGLSSQAAQQTPGASAPVRPVYREEDHVVAQAERDILHFLLKYGDFDLDFPDDSPFFQGGEFKVTVAEFIRSSIDSPMHNTLCREAYDSFFESLDAGLERQKAVDRMLDGEDRELAEFVSGIYIDNYDLSVTALRSSLTARSSWLAMFVPKSLYVYAERLVQSRLNEVRARLATASEEEQTAILSEIIQLQNTQKSIKKNISNE